MTAIRRKPGRTERGQSLVEFALVIPVLLILVFGIIDFGMGLRAYITVTQATREGARFGAVGNDPGTFTSGGAGQCNGTTTTTIVGKVCTTMNGLSLSDLNSVAGHLSHRQDVGTVGARQRPVQLRLHHSSRHDPQRALGRLRGRSHHPVEHDRHAIGVAR